MIINDNPYISDLLISATWDISGTTPQIIIENLSTGANLAGMVWAFVANSPSQTPIHAGNINSPDITGNWTSHTLNDAWPRPFNQIEWDGAYTLYVIAKDGDGNIFTSSPVLSANICRPFGNLQTSKNTYGIATSDVKVQCQDAAVFFQDTTYHTYKGSDGTQVSSVLRVIYPIDETLVIPDPFVAAAYSTALVPISYSSNNYQFVQTSVYDYELAPNTFVRIKYQSITTFPVYCNIDLLPLRCEIDKLTDSIINGNCSDVNAAINKLTLITPKFLLVVMGILQPLTGVDVPGTIEQIKAIGGFDCNCCGAPSGIIPTTSSIIGGYNFIFNKLGGDVNGSWTTNGNNITLNIGDVKYVVTVANNSPSGISAFSFTPTVSGDGFTKTYSLVVDGTQLATDILNIIKTNAGLVNLFNSIVAQGGSGSGNLLVDGKCIFDSSAACDLVFGLTLIPATTTFAGLVYFVVGGVQVPLNFSFNQTNLPALQSYLNGLGLGTFVVTNAGSGNVTITSAANTHNITALLYVSVTKKFAAFSSDCTGIVEVTANFAVQSIIDYLCGLDDSQIVTSQAYEICYIDPSSQQKVVETIPAGEALTDFLSELVIRGCNTIDYIISLGATNCGNIQKIFQPSSGVMQSNDVFYGTKVGQCAPIYPVEALTRMLQMIVYNQDGMTAFCNAVTLCAGGLLCTPYTLFQLTVIHGSPTDDLEILVYFVHPLSSTTPPQVIKNTIRYARTDNTSTPIYTTIPNVFPGQTPYALTLLPEGSYNVGITPIYADGRACPEVIQNTGFPTGKINAFSAVFNGTDIIISYNAPGGMPKVRVNINYPNGGQFSHIYNNTGVDITIVPPADNFGNYEITMTAVYNEDTGYFGETTAPAIVTVTPANNSTLVNNTSNTLTPISMSALDGNSVVVIPFSIATVAGGGGIINFYAPPVVIGSIVITFGTGTVGEAYLISGSTYIGIVDTNNVSFDTADRTLVSGMSINLIDPSPAP